MTKIGNLSYKPKSTHPGSFTGLNPSTSSSPDLKHKQICLMLLIKSVFDTSFPGLQNCLDQIQILACLVPINPVIMICISLMGDLKSWSPCAAADTTQNVYDPRQQFPPRRQGNGWRKDEQRFTSALRRAKARGLLPLSSHLWFLEDGVTLHLCFQE